MLIAAASGRALAASARRGGYAPLVADFFADQDLLAVADGNVRLAAGLARGMEPDEVLAAIATLSAGREATAVVCGTGFEDRPELLDAIARRWELLGNTPDTVAKIKKPLAFAAMCQKLRIPHPPTALAPPADPAQWLVKRTGGAGGHHIRPAAGGETLKPGHYFQRRVRGKPISALLLADGRRALVLGFSMQWPSPTARHPFRYGGAARPAPLAPAVEHQMREAVERLMSELPLRGLNSADFLVEGDDFVVLEINPRPGATIDLFEPPEGSLFALHVAACRGALPERAPEFGPPAAAEIVYAERDFRVPDLAWPDWSADRPRAETLIAAGEPVCTVLASAATTGAAKALAEDRANSIRAQFGAHSS